MNKTIKYLYITIAIIIGIVTGFLDISIQDKIIIISLYSIAIFIAVILVEILKSKIIVDYLMVKLDPDKFLYAVDEQIKDLSNNLKLKENNKMIIECLKVNKIAGLVSKGLFSDAKELQNSIDEEKLNMNFKLLYEINKLSLLYASQQIEEANKRYLDKETYIKGYINNKKFKFSIMSLIATYNYYNNKLDESKIIFTEIKESKVLKILEVNCEYYLCLIEIKQCRTNEAKERLTELLEVTKKLYLNTLIQKELEKI